MTSRGNRPGGEDGDRPPREDEIRYIREGNDPFYDRVRERAADKNPLSPAAAIFYDPSLGTDEKYVRLEELQRRAAPESAEAENARSHLASLDAQRHGGIA